MSAKAADSVWKPFYLLTDGGARRRAGTLMSAVEAALEAAEGLVGFVQLREQVPRSAFPAQDAEVLFLAEKLAPLCERYQAKLLINRRFDFCASGLFAGAHIAKDSPPVETVRRAMSQGILGYSAHSISEALGALAQGCDYVLLSPIYAPISKQVPKSHVQGIASLHNLCSMTDKAVYALGGMSPTTLPSCLQAGATGVASLSSLQTQSDPARMLRDFVAAYRHYCAT